MRASAAADDQRLGLAHRLDLYGFHIGAWNRWEDTPANNFHGEIDDLRIYSGTLTEQEVGRLAAPTPGSESGLER